MKKALIWCTIVFLVLLVVGYIWCLFASWNNKPIWRIITSLTCFILSIIIFIILLCTLHNSQLSELLSGFKFELLQLALISLLLSFVIITV